MPESFTWLDGERLIRFARGALGEARDLVEARGLVTYTLLTTPRGREADATLAGHAAAVLDVPAGRVDEVSGELRGRVRGGAVVALGGGRVVDTAKAIAGADGLACASIPTTLSGAELTGFHRLPAGASGGRLVRPSLVVADPALMASQPMPDLVASAMNALAHAVEALYTPLANPLAEMAALHAAELLAAGVRHEPEPERDDLALGALLAGYASGLTGYAVHHVVCQTIVRVCGTPHAQTNAVVLPHSVRLMVDRAPHEIGRLARALGVGGEGAAAAPELVAGLAGRAGVSTLSDLGVTEESIPAVVQAVAPRPELQSMPRPPGAAELRALVESAL